jgi:predicted enzyme related to lactoylglutathione lyase
MTEELQSSQIDTTIIAIVLACVYVDDFSAALSFYRDTLGLEKQDDMGPQACLFRVGENSSLYLEGGNAPTGADVKKTRLSFVLGVPSASAMYEKLQTAGVRLVHPAPMHMGGASYWFQFYDPAGNVLEIHGGK